MACGFAAATGDVIVMFDADGSADPAEIPAFVAALVAGADFAKGSRFAPGGGSDDITLLRRTGNAGLNGVANALFGTSYTDLCYGYNAFWADLLPVLDLPDPTTPAPPDGMLWGDGFEIETVLNCRIAAAGLTHHRSALRRTPTHLRADEPAHLRRRHPRAAHARRRAAAGGGSCGPGARGRRAPRFDTVGTPAYARSHTSPTARSRTARPSTTRTCTAAGASRPDRFGTGNRAASRRSPRPGASR